MTRLSLVVVVSLLIAAGAYFLSDSPPVASSDHAAVPPATTAPTAHEVAPPAVTEPSAPTPLTLEPENTAESDEVAASTPAPVLEPEGPPPSFIGRIVDETGAPVDRARISGYANGGYQKGIGTASTNSDGRFSTKSAPPGTYDLQISASKLDMRYVTGLHVTTETIDIGTVTLAPAATLTGRVVDENGAPVPDLPLEAHHGTGTGRYAKTKTKTDAVGNFEVFLPESVPYRLEVDANGWKRWKSKVAFVPNSEGLEIAVTSVSSNASTITMIVSDATSGRPVTDFAVKTWHHSRRSGGSSRTSSDAATSEANEARDGRRVVVYDPSTHGWQVDAPGYGTERGRSDVGQREVSVALTPEARLSGRVMSGDTPLGDVPVLLGRRVLNAKETYNTWDSWEFDVDDFKGRNRRTTTDSAGHFALNGLSGGTYFVQIEPPDGALIYVDNVALRDGKATDLGRLEAPEWGRIEGQVLLPSGTSPVGLGVTAKSPGREARGPVAVDESGAFVIEKITPSDPASSPGEGGYRAWRLTVTPLELRSWTSDPLFGTEPFLPSGDQPIATPAAGQTVQLTIDLRERVACERAVLVSAGGLPLDGVQIVSLYNGKALGSRDFHRTTNSDGIAFLRVPCLNPITLQLESDRDIAFGNHELPPGSSTPATPIELDAGRLVMLLPQPLTDVPSGAPRFTHWPSDTNAEDARSRMAGTKAWRREVSEGATRVDVGAFPSGSWGVRLHVGESTWSGTAVVSRGLTTEVALSADG